MEFQQEDALTKPVDIKLIGRLLSYARPHTLWIAISVIIILFVTISNLLGPYLIKIAIDDYINVYSGTYATEAIEGVLRIGAFYLLVIFAGFVLNYAQIYIMSWVGQRIICNIRQEVFTHIQGLSLSFFDKNPIGRLVTRVTNDTDTLNEMYTSVVTNLISNLFVLR